MTRTGPSLFLAEASILCNSLHGWSVRLDLRILVLELAQEVSQGLIPEAILNTRRDCLFRRDSLPHSGRKVPGREVNLTGPRIACSQKVRPS